jgi:hypothetical protein
MPLKPNNQTNVQFCSYTDAKALMAKLTALGVPVGPLYENVQQGPETDLVLADPAANPNYEVDPTTPLQYVTTFWGTTQSVGLAIQTLGAGGFNNFVNLASNTFTDRANAENAVLALGTVMRGVDAALVL